MALPSERMEFRITLSHVDRGLTRSETVIAARHPSETAEHLVLRVLAWCLLGEPRLEFGPGLSTPDAADLWAHDLTGQLTTWVECGAVDEDKLRKVVQHHRGMQTHVVFAGERRRDELREAWRERGRSVRGASISLWVIDEALVGALAAQEARRQTWAVTIVGEHIYVDADGRSLDGAVDKSELGAP